MDAGIESLTARFQAATISSKCKEKNPLRETPLAHEAAKKGGALSKVSSRLISLTQRIGIGAVPKMVPAELIDHETADGRTIFFDQLCYLLRSKVPRSQYKPPV